MEYDVALSFAEENRKYVSEVANELRMLELRVFFDAADAAGFKDLPANLHIYEKQARFTVVFVSEEYVKNLNSQLEMLLTRLDRDQRLLIARFDDAIIELLAGKSFFDLRNISPRKFSCSMTPLLKSYLFDNTNPETFISKIKINKSRNISDLTINLSENKRKHLILTGRNGSGKTSLLNDLKYFFQVAIQNGYGNFITQVENLLKYSCAKEALISSEISSAPDEISKQLKEADAYIKTSQIGLKHFGDNEVYFTNPKDIQKKTRFGGLILKYFGANRQADFQIPSGIEKVKSGDTEKIDEQVSSFFIQYLVNLKAEKSFANDDGEIEVVERLDEWFDRFEKRLRDIFDSPSLRLKFNGKSFNFEIIEDDKLPAGLDKLPGGYAAILNIVAELIMKTDAHNLKADDLEGVVLIDEIETHLDIELQKRALPFLIDFFPKIQFIVATHSPFVISSSSNAVVCDLEKRSVVSSDLQGSY